MYYKISPNCWNKVLAVPTEIIDKHLKLCSPLALRLILLLLRSENSGSLQELAAFFACTKEDIEDAANYWISHDILCIGSSAVPDSAEAPVQKESTPPKAPPAADEEPVPPAKKEERINILSRGRSKLSSFEIAEMANSDKNIGDLLSETESILQKPLTPVIRECIVSLYTYYEMKPDLILMLLQYCVSIGQESMRYLEKMASVWAEKGIDTHEKAESEILKYLGQNSIEGKIKRMFGITDRNLVSSEQKYIQSWINDYMVDLKLLEVAYERTIELKGKLSFAYINGIIKNWHRDNIDTPAKALKAISENKKQGKSPDTAASYDMKEIENMINYSKIDN